MPREVAVVGAGLVGAALALALHRRGLDVVLLDRAPAPRAPDGAEVDLRVLAISPASAAFLESLGAWQRLPPQRLGPYHAMRVWGAQPDAALTFAAAEVRRRELGWIVEHDQLAWALWGALEDVERRCGVAVNALQAENDVATLTLADGSALRARLVIAADGAESPLRDLAGIDVAGWRYDQRAIVCHVRTQRPHQGVALQRFLPTGPLAFLPLADGRSSIVWSSTQAGALLALDDAGFAAALGEASQSALGAIESVTRRTGFALRMLHAQAYALERFALAGDAAHVVHPLAGQGVNLGFADAAALAAELAPGADPGALRKLKRYERARRADNLEMIAVTDALYRAFGVRLPGLDAVLQAGMAAVDGLAAAKRPLMRRALGLTA